MINISSEGLKALKNEAVQKIKIHVSPLSGSDFIITDSDILLDGFVFENHSVDGEELQIGNMNSAVLDLTLDNANGKFSGVKFAGAVLKPQIGITLSDGTVEWLRFGEFTVDEQPHLWETIELSAFDNMVRLDYPFNYTDFPVSMRALVQTGISQCGLTCNDYSMFPETLIPSVFTTQSITWRQVIMWCCQCACVNGIADELGNIKFGYYTKILPETLLSESDEAITTESGEKLIIDGNFTADYVLPASERLIDGMSIDEDDITVTGHRFVVNGAVYPDNVETNYCLETKDNLIFSALSDEDKTSIATAVNDAIKGFTYRPFNCNIISLPILQTLDSIKYMSDRGNHYSIITNIEYTPNGLMSIKANSKSQRAKGYASLGVLTSGQQAIVEQINKDTEKTQQSIGLEIRTRMAINEAMYNSMGFYSTTVTNEDGSQIKYCHDKPNLADSKVVYKITLEGTAWTSNYKGNSTVWQYGVDINGNAVFSTIVANSLSANLIKTGILKSKNGASWINLDNGTFSFGKKDILGLINVPMLSLDDDGYISMFGRIRSQLDKDLSLGFWGQGISIRDDSKAIGSKERFAVDVSNNSVDISAGAAGDNLTLFRRCRISMSKNNLFLVHGNYTATGSEAYLRLSGDYSNVGAAEFQLNADRKGIKTDGNKVVLYTGTHTAYLNGDGTFYVENIDLVSDRAKKENIENIFPQALETVENMNFYSYNIINSGSKVRMGVMADEAPEEILGTDGKSINAYSFMCYIARAVQELSEIVKSQADEIAALKEEIQNIKEALKNENQ